jgi:hypothetical protein
MSTVNKRVVTYLSPVYKKKLASYCENMEESEAYVVRYIIKNFFDSTGKKETKQALSSISR